MTINTITTQIEMQKKPTMENIKINDPNCFKIRNELLREFLAELFGTFLLMVFINGSVAQNVFQKSVDPNMVDVFGINLTIGFAITLIILVVGKVSGAHINPAVSLSMFVLKRISIKKFFVYVSAQLIGAFLGSLSVYMIYFEMINSFDPEYTMKTASIFSTYPDPRLSIFGGILDQIFSTSILLIFILSITDERNEKFSPGASAAFIGMAVTIIGSSFGFNCGYAINPARDLGPRMMTAVSGWGLQVFTANDYFFLIPIFGPLTGALFGTVIYYAFIGNHFPNEYKDIRV